MGSVSARIVIERTKMAMPETNIGLFPDAGGGFFLSHCPGHLGEYLALTGQMIEGPQAVAAGLADQAVASERPSNLWEALADYGTPEADTRFDELDWKDQAPGVGHLARSASADQLHRHRRPGRPGTC